MKFVKYKDHKYVIKKDKLALNYQCIKNISDIEGLDKLDNLHELNLKSNHIYLFSFLIFPLPQLGLCSHSSYR